MANSHESSFTYKAFISYAQDGIDQKAAVWLQSAIEEYRVPKSLIQLQGQPARVGKVFRDATDTRFESSLSELLKDKLDASEFLIVLCSPRSDRPWVNAEVRYFLDQRGPANLIPVLIEGEPPGTFPKPLRDLSRSRQQESGEPGLSGVKDAPLAPDLRERPEVRISEIRRDALLKIVAALIDCDFDDLRQRDKERAAQRRRNLLTGGLILAFAILSLVTWGLYQVRLKELEAKEKQRQEARKLIAEGSRVLYQSPLLAVDSLAQARETWPAKETPPDEIGRDQENAHRVASLQMYARIIDSELAEVKGFFTSFQVRQRSLDVLSKLSLDLKYVVTVSPQHDVTLIDNETGRATTLAATSEGGQTGEPIRYVGFSEQDNRVFVVRGYDLFIYDTRGRQVLDKHVHLANTLPTKEQPHIIGGFMAGNVLIGGDSVGQVTAFDPLTSQSLQEIEPRDQGHGALMNIRVSPDSESAVLIFESGRADFITLAENGTFTVHKEIVLLDAMNAVFNGKDSNDFLVFGHRGQISRWTFVEGELSRRDLAPAHGDLPICHAVFTPDSERFITQAIDRGVVIWNAMTNSPGQPINFSHAVDWAEEMGRIAPFEPIEQGPAGGEVWETSELEDLKVSQVVQLSGVTWLLAPDGISRIKVDDTAAQSFRGLKNPARVYRDEVSGETWISADNAVIRYRDDRIDVLPINTSTGIMSHQHAEVKRIGDALWIQSPHAVYRVDGERAIRVTPGNVDVHELLDLGGSPWVVGAERWNMYAKRGLVYRIRDDLTHRVALASARVFSTPDQRIWISDHQETRIVENGQIRRVPGLPGDVTAVNLAGNKVLLTVEKGPAYLLDESAGGQVIQVPNPQARISKTLRSNGQWWLLGDGPAYRVPGGEPFPVAECVVTDVVAVGEELWFATDRGAYRLAGTSLSRIPDVDLDVRAVTPIGEDVWLASDSGVFRLSGADAHRITDETADCVRLQSTGGAVWAWLNDGSVLRIAGDQVSKLKKSDTDTARDVLVIGGKVYAFLQPKRGEYELTQPPGALCEVDESAIETLPGSGQSAAIGRAEKPGEEDTPETEAAVKLLRAVVDAASDLERTEALWNLATLGEGDEAVRINVLQQIMQDAQWAKKATPALDAIVQASVGLNPQRRRSVLRDVTERLAPLSGTPHELRLMCVRIGLALDGRQPRFAEYALETIFAEFARGSLDIRLTSQVDQLKNALSIESRKAVMQRTAVMLIAAMREAANAESLQNQWKALAWVSDDIDSRLARDAGSAAVERAVSLILGDTSQFVFDGERAVRFLRSLSSEVDAAGARSAVRRLQPILRESNHAALVRNASEALHVISDRLDAATVSQLAMEICERLQGGAVDGVRRVLMWTLLELSHAMDDTSARAASLEIAKVLEQEEIDVDWFFKGETETRDNWRERLRTLKLRLGRECPDGVARFLVDADEMADVLLAGKEWHYDHAGAKQRLAEANGGARIRAACLQLLSMVSRQEKLHQHQFGNLTAILRETVGKVNLDTADIWRSLSIAVNNCDPQQLPELVEFFLALVEHGDGTTISADLAATLASRLSREVFEESDHNPLVGNSKLFRDVSRHVHERAVIELVADELEAAIEEADTVVKLHALAQVFRGVAEGAGNMDAASLATMAEGIRQKLVGMLQAEDGFWMLNGTLQAIATYLSEDTLDTTSQEMLQTSLSWEHWTSFSGEALKQLLELGVARATDETIEAITDQLLEVIQRGNAKEVAVASFAIVRAKSTPSQIAVVRKKIEEAICATDRTAAIHLLVEAWCETVDDAHPADGTEGLLDVTRHIGSTFEAAFENYSAGELASSLCLLEPFMSAESAEAIMEDVEQAVAESADSPDEIGQLIPVVLLLHRKRNSERSLQLVTTAAERVMALGVYRYGKADDGVFAGFDALASHISNKTYRASLHRAVTLKGLRDLLQEARGSYDQRCFDYLRRFQLAAAKRCEPKVAQVMAEEFLAIWSERSLDLVAWGNAYSVVGKQLDTAGANNVVHNIMLHARGDYRDQFLARMVAFTPCRIEAETLMEYLTWPTCTGGLRQAILAKLSRSMDSQFSSVSQMVNWVEEEQAAGRLKELDLGRPPIRERGP